VGKSSQATYKHREAEAKAHFAHSRLGSTICSNCPESRPKKGSQDPSFGTGLVSPLNKICAWFRARRSLQQAARGHALIILETWGPVPGRGIHVLTHRLVIVCQSSRHRIQLRSTRGKPLKCDVRGFALGPLSGRMLHRNLKGSASASGSQSIERTEGRVIFMNSKRLSSLHSTACAE
jgi:hypothetical protein